MKRNINTKTRFSLIVLVLLLICVSSILLVRQIKSPGFKDEKVSLYNYNTRTNASYRVFFKPNILYDQQSQGENGVYISEFTDYMNTTFNYEFKGQDKSDIKCDYEVVAVLEGYTPEKDGEKTTNKTIWNKQIILAPKESISSKDGTVSITKDVTINFQEYNSFVKKVIEDSKVSSLVKLSIIMNVNLTTQTDKGFVEEKASPAIIIPLNVTSFEIAKEQIIDKPGAIEEVRRVELPMDTRAVMFYSVILGVLILALLYLIFLCSGVRENDPLAKSLNKIFKKYGTRLVALDSDLEASGSNCVMVRSMDDLVRTADEIGKPIIYKYSPDYISIRKFYTCDNEITYAFELNSSTLSEPVSVKSKGDTQPVRSNMGRFHKFRLIPRSLKAGRHEPNEKTL